MTKLFASLILFIIVYSAQFIHAQNLVPNPSFEDTVYCPYATGLSAVKDWSSYAGTPDYFNACSKDTIIPQGYVIVGVPNNVFGFQFAHSGNAYAGGETFDQNDPVFREIIGTQLTTPLAVGTKYFVSFWVSPAFQTTYDPATCFTNKIGIRFSMMEYDHQSNPAPIDNYADIYTDSIISDTSTWTQISGTFIADQAYPYIMIGNFFDDFHLDTIVGQFNTDLVAYYYIDDVCVSTDSTECSVKSATQPEPCTEMGLYPNPCHSFLIVTNPCQNIQNISIFNLLGQTVLKYDVVRGENEIQFNDLNLPDGNYLIEINQDNKEQIFSLVFLNH